MSDDPDYSRVALACQRLRAEGGYPSVRNVQRMLKDHLGGGIKTERIGALIRRWEMEAGEDGKAPPPEAAPLTLETVLESHPDLRPAIEALAAALATTLEARARRESEDRVRALQSATDTARAEEAQRVADLRAAHATAEAERETVIETLRHQEAAQVEEIDRLETALAAQSQAADSLRQDLARREEDARTLTARNRELAERLAQAEDRAAALPKLEADLAALNQSLAVAGETRGKLTDLVSGLRSDLQVERSRTEALHDRIEHLVADLATATATAKLPSPASPPSNGAAPEAELAAEHRPPSGKSRQRS